MAAVAYASSASTAVTKASAVAHGTNAAPCSLFVAQSSRTFANSAIQLDVSFAPSICKPVLRKSSTAAYAVESDVGSAEAPEGTRLYVGNLPFNVDSESLARYFSGAGEVDQVDVIYDRDTGRSRGFAFVSMATVDDARNAIEQFDGAELAGRSLKVTFPTPRGERPPRTVRPTREKFDAPAGIPGSGNKLYVGNLSWGVDDYGLADLFAEYGQILEAKVVMDRDTGKSRGFGFVTFSSPEEGNSAVERLDGAEIDGRTIRVTVAQDRPARSF